MTEPNAILAISSLDRYNLSQGLGGKPASSSNSLENQYNKTGAPCNNFQIGGFGALIYGYIKKIQISQTQLQYNVPTVVPDGNDQMLISLVEIAFPNTINYALLKIPFGYATPEELAALLQIQYNNSSLYALSPITIRYRSESNDFDFEVLDNQTYKLAFPTLIQIKFYLVFNNINPAASTIILKTYRLFGIDITNSVPSNQQFSGVNPEFLYTQYVDIFSTALTKYQKVKDNSSSAAGGSCLIARIFLSGEGIPQNTGGEASLASFDGTQPVPITNYAYPLGSRPFVVVQDCNTPKVVRWNQDEAVYTLDFQLRDQYGDLLFTQFDGGYLVPNDSRNSNTIFYTEFQMTLTCIEGERH